MKEFFTNPAVWSIVLFFILNLINVVLGTMRSILTVKSTPFISMLINTISYTFYAGIVKLTSGQSMTIVLISTALTNIIGVYLANFILNKLKKDKLWRISATVKENSKSYLSIIERLDAFNIEYNITSAANGKVIIDIFSETQGQSALIKEIFQKTKVKYHVIEIDKTL